MKFYNPSSTSARTKNHTIILAHAHTSYTRIAQWTSRPGSLDQKAAERAAFVAAGAQSCLKVHMGLQ